MYQGLEGKDERFAKTLIFVIGVLEGLKERGLVNGPSPLTIKGLTDFATLKASGFRPTDAEMEAAVAFIQSGGLAKCLASPNPAAISRERA